MYLVTVQGSSFNKRSCFLIYINRNVNFCFEIEFATSHSKRVVVDGIGEIVKRSVWRHVKSGHVNISTPKHVAQERNKNIHVHYIIAKAQIDSFGAQLNEQWANVITESKTHKLHCFIPNGEEPLRVSEISDSKDFTV